MSKTSAFAEEILKIGQTAQSEEDLKIAVQRLLDETLKDLGLDYEAKYEKTVYKSRRADALYPNIVLEYKKPKTLKYKHVQKKAIEELGYYLKGLSKTEKVPRKFVGVALDGETILFVRTKPISGKIKRKGLLQVTLEGRLLEEEIKEWEVIGPEPISEASIERLILYFRALVYKIITPDNLAADFGSESETGKKFIKVLYQKLETIDNPKVEMLFEEWSRIFGVVYGQDLRKLKKDVIFFAKKYELPENANLQKLLFSVHTYFALLMKMLAAETIALQPGSLFPSTLQKWSIFDDEKLMNELLDLENGGLFKRFGILNFMEGDFFSWYLEIWDAELSNTIRHMAQKLSDYEPATPRLEPEETKDLLKKLYQYLVPKKIRHDLGEYYTPDWLAELVLGELGYDGDPSKRILDPACGSGTFLVLAIKKILKKVQDNPEFFPDKTGVLRQILENVVGFDINPLAVLASRTNYLIATAEFPRTSEIEIPVYLCDSVLSPKEYASVFGKTYRIRTAVGDFLIPTIFAQKKIITEILDILDRVIELKSEKMGAPLFVENVRKSLPFEITKQDEHALRVLFTKIEKLEKQGRNQIWTNIIKNNFAPLYVGKFDFVAGNPPWIRWGYLSDEYRQLTMAMWKDYGLFSLKGMAARLGGGEKDFSMLFTYASCDFYLEDKSKLGFLVTQEVFKAKGAGEGFRRFRLGKGLPFKILKVHDLVKVKPFEGAANKTSLLTLMKGKETTYPLPYILWVPKKRVHPDATLDEAMSITERKNLIAKPIDKAVGSWLTIEEELEKDFDYLVGESDYTAFRGASLDPYGVYFVKIKHVRPDGKLIVENLPELGKKAIKKTKAVIEPDLVFPAVRGGDINRWKMQTDLFVIVPQDPEKRVGYPEEWMMKNLPDTYRYFLSLKDVLLQKALYWKYFSKTITSEIPLSENDLKKRGKYFRLLREREENGKKIFVYQVSNAPFYTVFNIAEYSFSPNKVVWSRMASDMKAVVCTKNRTVFGERIPISTGTTSLVSLGSELEAHYLCALLNSNLVRQFIKSFSSAGRGFGAPSILSHINISKFDEENMEHVELAELSMEAHHFASTNDAESLATAEKEIEKLSRKILKVD